MPTALLETNDLRKVYGNTTALGGVTLQVYEGEIFGLLGPNGAGKSTLISIVSGLAEPTAGRVQIAGRNATPSDRDVRRLVGIVPQDLAIYGELTACENLTFFGRLYGIGEPELSGRVTAILEAVGLVDRARERVESYSGGMKRRLNLAVALIHRPSLLLLDEPTAGVDPQSRNRIFEEVRRLNRSGTTIVYTTHYMEEVEALCTRVGIIDHGRLVACDTLPNLLRAVRGSIRFRVSDLSRALRSRLEALPGARLVHEEGSLVELECEQVTATLLRVVSLVSETGIELVSLETIEPSLERVFLALTGHELRD